MSSPSVLRDSLRNPGRVASDRTLVVALFARAVRGAVAEPRQLVIEGHSFGLLPEQIVSESLLAGLE